MGGIVDFSRGPHRQLAERLLRVERLSRLLGLRRTGVSGPLCGGRVGWGVFKRALCNIMVTERIFTLR
jgi:hypothetical protein